MSPYCHVMCTTLCGLDFFNIVGHTHEEWLWMYQCISSSFYFKYSMDDHVMCNTCFTLVLSCLSPTNVLLDPCKKHL
jgi:hypothetical protein